MMTAQIWPSVELTLLITGCKWQKANQLSWGFMIAFIGVT